MKHPIFKHFLFSIILVSNLAISQPIIINHHCAKLQPITETAILNAKQNLHIAYGHTSHGSQLTDGMTGLIGQTNLVGYKGDIYNWNNGGTNGALDIDDYFVSGDLGHNGDTQWATDTRTYLNNPANSDVNVIVWSWCGGCSDNTYEGIQTYLDTMNQLEMDYPNVKFVYMTGHTDIWSDAILKANNEQIRAYCVQNNKILYDFEDIERYDPDGNYYEFSTDNCNYYENAGASNLLGNWAVSWQNSHTEGVDWYSCSTAHSEPLNGNLKAYAAWNLWCRLAGWEGTGIENISNSTEPFNFYPNPVVDKINMTFTIVNNAHVLINIYDLTGKHISNFLNKNLQSGMYEYSFSTISMPSGTYLLKFESGNKIQYKKMILSK